MLPILSFKTRPSKITGEGENFPIDTNATVTGRYNNRRVEIFIENIKFKEQVK